MKARLGIGLLTLLMALNALACSRTQTRKLPRPKAIVMQYHDFGPPSVCYERLGLDKYQWISDVDDPHRHFDIKIVVYRDIALDDIKTIYPVKPEANQDFRYVEYQSALKLLKEYNNPSWDDLPIIPATRARALQTKQKILQELGE